MSQPRRFVTGVDESGRSYITIEDELPRYRDSPTSAGRRMTSVWEGIVPPTTLAVDSDPHSDMELIPPPGSARVLHVRIPPNDPALAEPIPSAPEVGNPETHFDPKRGAGMHATPTIDVLMVTSGSVDLIMETEVTTLALGDVVVQRGTWHAWSNPYEVPCELFGVNLAMSPES